MEAKFKIGETLIITDDPDESKRGKEVVVVDTFHCIRKSKVSESAVDLWEYKVEDGTRLIGWISEYHLKPKINMKRYTYTFDKESEVIQFKNVLDAQGVKYQLNNYTLLGDPFTDITINAQIKPAVDMLYLEVKRYGININPLK